MIQKRLRFSGGSIMSFHALKLALAIGEIDRHTQDLGLTIKLDFDMAELHRCVKSLKNPYTVSPEFALDKFDFTEENGFWMLVTGEGCRSVCIHAVRLDRLGSKSLADFWMRQQPRIYGENMGDSHGTGALSEIRGDVVYQGDMWVSEDWRHLNIGGWMTVMGQLVAMLQWHPNYLYIFMTEQLVLNGFAARCGYVHQEPSRADWRAPADGVSSCDYLLWNSAADIFRLADLIADGSFAPLQNMQ